MDITTETSKTETQAELVNAGTIVDMLGGRMPPVTETKEADKTAETSTTERTETKPLPDARDSRGTKFSSRHQTNADGSPRKNKHGNFMTRTDYRELHDKAAPNGQPRKAAPQSFSPAADRNEPAPPSFNAPGSAQKPVDPNVREPMPDEYDFAAEMYLQSGYGPLIVGFSEHARPDEEQHAALKVALANYLRAKQISEPSPGWALLFVVTAVVVKKSENPIVMERGVSLWNRIKNWFSPQKFAAPIKTVKP